MLPSCVLNPAVQSTTAQPVFHDYAVSQGFIVYAIPCKDGVFLREWRFHAEAPPIREETGETGGPMRASGPTVRTQKERTRKGTGRVWIPRMLKL